MRSKRMLEVAHCLIHIWKFTGPSLILHSDNGKEFANLANGRHVLISDEEMAKQANAPGASVPKRVAFAALAAAVRSTVHAKTRRDGTGTVPVQAWYQVATRTSR